PGFQGTSMNEGGQGGTVRLGAAAGEIIVRGSGPDIFGTSDGGYFLNQPLAGDFQLSVRCLTRPTNTHEWAKAGLMIRDSLEPSTRPISLFMTASHGLLYERRPNQGDSTVSRRLPETTSLRLPLDLRLTRRGDLITAAYSPDGGRSWKEVG